MKILREQYLVITNHTTCTTYFTLYDILAYTNFQSSSNAMGLKCYETFLQINSFILVIDFYTIPKCFLGVLFKYFNSFCLHGKYMHYQVSTHWFLEGGNGLKYLVIYLLLQSRSNMAKDSKQDQ